jgi:hypothetical protein
MADLCTCDMFPQSHPPGLIVDGVECEKTRPNPQASPHLLDEIEKLAQSSVATAPALSEDQQRTLKRILHGQQGVTDAGAAPGPVA